jgi:hypothetical protein
VEFAIGPEMQRADTEPQPQRAIPVARANLITELAGIRNTVRGVSL